MDGNLLGNIGTIAVKSFNSLYITRDEIMGPGIVGDFGKRQPSDVVATLVSVYGSDGRWCIRSSDLRPEDLATYGSGPFTLVPWTHRESDLVGTPSDIMGYLERRGGEWHLSGERPK